eukprot:m.32552 g.32552  ORF g.32552 m.32552 type:complete len:57 (+) comp7057_c0_seq2:3268-3438(+)
MAVLATSVLAVFTHTRETLLRNLMILKLSRLDQTSPSRDKESCKANASSSVPVEVI